MIRILGLIFVIILLCSCKETKKDRIISPYTILSWDIPKIIKFKATNSLRVSCLFCIFKHSPQKTV